MQYAPQGQPQVQYVPQGSPQVQYVPQGYQPQGQYSSQGYQPSQGPFYVPSMGTFPFNYQPYPQLGYGSQYPQPYMGQYPEMNMVWDPSQGQQVMQPSIQMSSQTRQPLVSGSTLQPVQSNIQTSVSSIVSQSPIAPSTPSQTTVVTTATSIQSTAPTSGVSIAPVSTVSATTP